MSKRMTQKQSRKLKSLIKRLCCNYDSGICLTLDCPCPQMITSSLICRWCKNAVLPQDSELYVKIMPTGNIKRCAVCGKVFIPKSNRTKYCDDCKKDVIRRQAVERKRKQRSAVPN